MLEKLAMRLDKPKNAVMAGGNTRIDAAMNPETQGSLKNSMALREVFEEYADVFGIETGQTQATPNVNPNDAAAYKRMTNSADSGTSPEHNGDIMQKLMNANSKEELDEVIRLSGL
jgi:hypothetical protein